MDERTKRDKHDRTDETAKNTPPGTTTYSKYDRNVETHIDLITTTNTRHPDTQKEHRRNEKKKPERKRPTFGKYRTVARKTKNLQNSTDSPELYKLKGNDMETIIGTMLKISENKHKDTTRVTQKTTNNTTLYYCPNCNYR